MIGNNDVPKSSDDSTNTVSKDVAAESDDRSINRAVTPDDYTTPLKKRGAIYWHNDPATLRDYASNNVVQTFIDTIARDVAKQDYSIVEDEEINRDATNFLRYAHPTKSWQDLIESTVRNLDILGNSFWVIHYYENSDDVAEIYDPEPSTMFIEKGDDGFIQNYIHKPRSGSPSKIPKEDVLHFKLKSDTSKIYSDSFVSDSQSIIEILDEIQRKESLNLKKASQSGMLTQTDTHPTDPMDSEQWDDLVNYVTDTNQGKTHQISVGKGNFDFIPFEGKYKDLELRDRYKLWIQALGAQMGVNPSYVGFDFQNSNRATDESQRQAYKERGVRTIMANIKSKINRKLIPKISDDSAKFRWDIKQDDEIDEVEYYERLGNAVNALEESGVNVDITDDDKIEVLGFTDEESENVEQESMEQKPDKVDECVESVLSENPDMDKSDAYAICNDTVDTKDIDQSLESLSDRKREFMEAVPHRKFADAIEWIDTTVDNREDAISFIQATTNGTLSKSTYYNWLDEYDLR